MFDTIVALGTIALQLFIVITLVAWIARAPLAVWVARHASIMLRVIFLGAVVGSLIYSNVLGFAPCILCWYQRLVIFPVAFLAFTGNIAKSALLRGQVLILSSIGFAIALFHRYIELFPQSGVSVCGPDGVACDTLYVFEFGYITIPMMSLTVLAAGILLSLLASRFPQTALAEAENKLIL